jgi:hypothetical protein
VHPSVSHHGSLPLHIADEIIAAAFEWDDVIDHVSGARAGAIVVRGAGIRFLERGALGSTARDRSGHAFMGTNVIGQK